MSNDLSLYEITNEFKKLDELLEQSGGEVDESFELLEAEISALLTSKVDACVGYRERELDYVELAKKRIKQLQEFIKTKENKMSRFDGYIMQCMERFGKTELLGALRSIKTRKPSRSVVIENQDIIPAEFVTIVQDIKISKKEISDAIKSGREVPGASLVSGKPTLMFK